MTDAYDVTFDRTPRRVVVKLYRDGDGTAPLEWSRLQFAQRVALPYATKGWQEQFWSTTYDVINRIKQVRGTVVPPARTGPITDVLYSAAGNEADEAWYAHQMIAFSFEAGVRRSSASLP